jgi:hypothetical protein
MVLFVVWFGNSNQTVGERDQNLQRAGRSATTCIAPFLLEIILENYSLCDVTQWLRKFVSFIGKETMAFRLYRRATFLFLILPVYLNLRHVVPSQLYRKTQPSSYLSDRMT